MLLSRLMGQDCTYCDNYKAGTEVIFHEDNLIYVVRAKDMKGHEERLVLVSKAHVKDLPEGLEYKAKSKGIEVARDVFGKIKGLEFISYLQDTKSRFGSHWHRIICDLDPDADDWEQIIKDTEYEEYPIRP
jgi:hypothetical protein